MNVAQFFEPMETFLMRYGLVAVFVAAMGEADVVPVVSGVVAHLGYFNFVKAIAVASAGAFMGDCIWFWLGSRHSEWIRSSRIYLRTADVVAKFDRRWGIWQIPASHVVYGTRIATMTLSGLKKMPFPKFAVMDLMGCVVFTTIFATLGFLFSSSAALIIGHVKRVELFLLVVVVVTALIFHLVKAK